MKDFRKYFIVFTGHNASLSYLLAPEFYAELMFVSSFIDSDPTTNRDAVGPTESSSETSTAQVSEHDHSDLDDACPSGSGPAPAVTNSELGDGQPNPDATHTLLSSDSSESGNESLSGPATGQTLSSDSESDDEHECAPDVLIQHTYSSNSESEEGEDELPSGLAAREQSDSESDGNEQPSCLSEADVVSESVAGKFTRLRRLS